MKKQAVIWLIPVLLFGLILTSFSCDTKKMSQQLLYNRARNFHDHGKLDQAIEIYKRIVETQGDHSEVYYDLGVAYADQHDVVNAKKQVEILRKMDRRDLAQVLDVVIRDSDSSRVRKKLQSDYDEKN